jgi:sterol 3beta-glucosyltransferase
MIKRNELPIPMIYPISPFLFKNIREFEKEVFLSGFPILKEAKCLDQETEEFLQQGKKPIVITFSSMPLKNPESFLDKIVHALQVSNNRGILLVGNSGIQMSSNKNVLVKEFMNHDVIFEYAKGIVHHGGVGTMAAALRSGKPQVIMPFNVDQPFWAKRLYDLGYALKPLSENDEEKEFVNRFNAMDKDIVIQQSEQAANAINQENPNEKAVEYIEQLYKKWNSYN